MPGGHNDVAPMRCVLLVDMMRLNSSSAIAAKFLIPAAKEKESEQTRMHALNFVADLSFQ